MRAAVLVGLVACSTSAWAQAPAPASLDEPRWKEVCAQAVRAPLPADAAALAEQATRGGTAECDEGQLYYGFGKPPDDHAALLCAYRHRAHERPGAFMDGAGYLTMLYANGRGVARNYGLALRFACETNAADAETEGRVARFEALRDGKLKASKPFDLCEDATSGAMAGWCASIEEKQADAGRQGRMHAVEASLNKQARAMLPGLQAAEKSFEDARGKGEYPGGGGTASAGFLLYDQGKLREQFLLNLENFARGNAPDITGTSARSAAEAAVAKAAIAASAKQPAQAKVTDQREPTREGVQATQRAWEGLYQAWLKFAAVAYPGLHPDRVAVELCRLRLHQLQHV